MNFDELRRKIYEREQSDVMCEYCNGELLFGNASTWVEVEILDGELDICTDDMRVQIPINYCPMCGERLEED